MENDMLFTVVVSTLLLLLLVATLVIVFFVWSKQRIKQEAKWVESQLLFEKELRQVEHEVREVTMMHFAHELHDNIGQLLTASMIQIENQKLDYPQDTQKLKPLEIYLAEAVQQLRLLSRTMNQEYVLRTGLVHALKTEIERLRGLKRFTVHVDGLNEMDLGLTGEQELVVFRIFQETVQNALKHAEAKNMYIYVQQVNNVFALSVKDDGKGFDAQAVMESGKANGLRNMVKRAQLANLVCTVLSTVNKGCTVEIKQLKQ